MDTRQLRVFIAVYECANITAAAQRLYVSQPSLSASLQQLESSLAAPLFERLPRGVRPTAAGQRLYPQALRLLNELDALRRQFSAGGDCIQLELGVEEEVGAPHLQALCRLLGQLQPAPLLRLLHGCAGEIRLGLAHQRCSDELFLPLWQESMLIALPPGHALAACTQLQPAQVAAEEWAICPQDASHASLLAALGSWQPDCPAQVAHLQQAAALVAAGQALACLPPSMLPPGVHGVPLAGLEYQREIGLSYHPAVLQQPGPAALLALCRSLPSAVGLAGLVPQLAA